MIHPTRIIHHVATKTVATLMDCGGINTLIDASEEYTEGEDVPQLTAVQFIWRALRNITFKKNATKDTLSRYQSIALFDTGIDVISRIKSVPADDTQDLHQYHSTFLNYYYQMMMMMMLMTISGFSFFIWIVVYGRMYISCYLIIYF